MVRISGLELQYIPFIGRWNNPLILSIDPNFLGHSSIPSEGGCYSHPIWLQGHSCLQLINKPTNPKSNPQLRGQQIKPQSCATIPTSPTTPKHTQPTPNPTIPHQTCHFSRRTPKGCGRLPWRRNVLFRTMSLVGGTQVISWHLKKGDYLENTSRIESPGRFHKGFGTCFFWLEKNPRLHATQRNAEGGDLSFTPMAAWNLCWFPGVLSWLGEGNCDDPGEGIKNDFGI